MRCANGYLLELVAVVLLSTACRPDPPRAGDLIELAGRKEQYGALKTALQLERYAYRQGPARGELWLAHIDPARVQLSVEVASQQPRPLAELVPPAERGEDRFIAINGGFYDDSGPLGLVVSHGHQVKRFRRNGGSGVLVVTGGIPEIVHRDGFKPNREMQHALQSIDRLVADGQVLVANRPNLPRDARSLIGIDSEGLLHLAVIYDEQSVSQDAGGFVYLNNRTTSTGPTLHDLAALAARPAARGGLGLQWALNLDGGWSSALVAQLDGRRFGVVGYRGTVNAVQARIESRPAP